MHCCSVLWQFVAVTHQRPTAQSKAVRRFDLVDMTRTGRQPYSIMRNMLYERSGLTKLQHISQQISFCLAGRSNVKADKV